MAFNAAALDFGINSASCEQPQSASEKYDPANPTYAGAKFESFATAC